MLEDLSLLGNVAAVPVVIAITQYLKGHLNFKRKADVIALPVSVLVCFGWEFFNLPETELAIVWGGSFVSVVKHVGELAMISVATWMSASKSYDLFVGEKKRAKVLDQHVVDKNELVIAKVGLEKELVKMRNGNGKPETPVSKNTDLDNKLRSILES